LKQTINSALLSEIATESVIDWAYVWVCKQRHHYPHNADIWHFRYHWQTNKQSLIAKLRSGRYLFSPLQRITLANGNIIHLWSAQDALVMKAIAIVLTPSLSISPRCTHTKGHGGLKGALRWLHRKLPFHRFVFRSDVKGYYQNIDHTILIKQLEQQVRNHDVMALLTQVIRRTVEWGGTFKTINRGVGRGSPLSPLFAAVYLKPLDDAMDQAGLSYVRYMDDWVVLSKTRWQLRRAVALVNRTLAALKLEKHPDKTWVGKIDRGVDFLAYHHTQAGCGPAKATLARFHAQLTRLQEQGARPARIGVYNTRWWRWVRAGLPKNLVLVIPTVSSAERDRS
jgi:RNA-directed DNA polymerase